MATDPTTDVGQQRIDHVRERHIDTLSSRFTDKPLVVVRAPAGYDKSHLAKTIAAKNKAPVAWCRVRPNSSDGELCAALTRELAAAWPQAGVDPSIVSDQNAQSLLTELLPLIGNTSVVLDDTHNSSTSVVDALLDNMLAGPTESLHLIVTTEGPLTAALLRADANGLVSHVGADTLAFSRGECVEMLDDQAAGHTLHEATGGWPIAALLRARSTLRGHPPPTDASLLQLALGSNPSFHLDRLTVAARLDPVPDVIFDWMRTDIAQGSQIDDVMFERHDLSWRLRQWAHDILTAQPMPARSVEEALALLDSRGHTVAVLALAIAAGRYEQALPLAESEARAAIHSGRQHQALQIVERIPPPKRSFELRLIAAAAGHATADRRPSEKTLFALVAEGHENGRPSPRANELLANHLRMNGDPRVVEVCVEVIGDLTDLSGDEARRKAKRFWPDELDRCSAAELLRFLGQITSLLPGPGNVARGRDLIEKALAILDDERSTRSQQAWMLYVEALMFVRSPESVVYNVRAIAMELWHAGHSDSALRLGELASLCLLTERYGEARSSLEFARESAAATGNNMALLPLTCLEYALDVVDNPEDLGLVDRFEAEIGNLLDHGHLVSFHKVYATEFGLLQLRLGNTAIAKRFSEIAARSPDTLLSLAYSLSASRLEALIDPDPTASQAALKKLRQHAAENERPALAALIDDDLARVSHEPQANPAAIQSDDRSQGDVLFIHAMGPTLVVQRGDQTLPPLIGFSAQLLATLIASAGVVAVDVALETLWPEVDPAVGRNRLHGVLLRLRRALGLGPDGPISCREDMVQLERSPQVRCDAWDYEQAATTNATDREAVAYPGDLLSEQFPYDDRIERYRRQLRLLAGRGDR